MPQGEILLLLCNSDAVYKDLSLFLSLLWLMVAEVPDFRTGAVIAQNQGILNFYTSVPMSS